MKYSLNEIKDLLGRPFDDCQFLGHFGGVLFLIFSLNAYSGIEFLNVLKQNQQSFGVPQTCKDQIAQSGPEAFILPELSSYKGKLVNFGMTDNIFYHYSPHDLGRVFEQGQGMKQIIHFQFSFSDALNNSASAGFYVADNPYSSRSYGNNLLRLTLSPEAMILNLTNPDAVYLIGDKVLQLQKAGFGECDFRILQTLIYDNNGIDLVFYSANDGWFVLLNEEVVQETDYFVASGDPISQIKARGHEEEWIGALYEFSGNNVALTFDNYRITDLNGISYKEALELL